MISDYKARDLGVKFLSKHGHSRLAKRVDAADYCLDTVFDKLLRRWGKRYVLHLYQELPRRLKEYGTCTLLSRNEWLRIILHTIDAEFNRGTRPINEFTKERLKEFKRRCNKVIMQYLRGEHNAEPKTKRDCF